MTFARDAAVLVGEVALAAWAASRGFRPILAGLSRAERSAWSVALGLAIEAAIELVVLAAGARPGPLPMAAGLGVVVVAAVFLRPPAPPAEARAGRPAAVMLAVAAGAALLFAIAAVSEPMWSNDFLAIWGFKAKTIALSGSIPGRLFHDPMTRWSHPEYPLFLPVTLAASSAAAGAWDDRALALLYPIFEIVLLSALYGGTKRRFGPAAGALSALLAALFFGFFRAFAVGMADIPLAALLVLFAGSLADFVETPSRAAGARLAIASFLCAATKQEGSLFVLLSGAWGAFFVLRARGRSRILSLLSLTAVPVLLHQLVLTALRGRIADRDYDWSLLKSGLALLPRAAAVARTILRDELAPHAVPLAALIVFLMVARPVGSARSLALLGPPLAAQLLVYAAVCVFSAFDPRWQAQFVPRLAATLFAVLLLAAGPRLAFVCGRRERAPLSGSEDSPREPREDVRVSFE